MKKVFNPETGEHDYIQDAEEEVSDSPRIAPQSPLESIRAAINTKTAKEKSKLSSASGYARVKQWRENHPAEHAERHRKYMLDYMKKYRKR